MDYAQKKAQDKIEGKMNVAQLLSSSKKNVKESEEPQQERTAQLKQQDKKAVQKEQSKPEKKVDKNKQKTV
jgi:hypothetical protein